MRIDKKSHKEADDEEDRKGGLGGDAGIALLYVYAHLALQNAFVILMLNCTTHRKIEVNRKTCCALPITEGQCDLVLYKNGTQTTKV